MNSKGFTLIEVLLAAMLLALAGVGLFGGLSQGIKAERSIREADGVYDPIRTCWSRMEKDLRNSVAIRGEKVSAKEDEMTFPVLVTEMTEGKKYFEIRKIHYFIKNGNLMRGEQKLSNQFMAESLPERVILKNVKNLKFKFAYLDPEEKLKFEPYWLEAPYFGIPRAVEIDAQLNASPQIFSKLISIPQGRWGHVPQGGLSYE